MATDTDTDEPTGDSIRSVLTWPVVVAATVLALLAAGAVLWVGGDDDDDSDDAVRLADPADLGSPLDVEVLLLDDSTTTIRRLLDGRPMVVNLFGSWCTPCVREMPDLQEVSAEMAGRVDFVGLAVNDRPEDASRIVEETGVTYPWFRDIPGDVLAAAKGTNMPTTLFVGADGTIVTVRSGALDAGALRDLITESFAGAT